MGKTQARWNNEGNHIGGEEVTNKDVSTLLSEVTKHIAAIKKVITGLKPTIQLTAAVEAKSDSTLSSGETSTPVTSGDVQVDFESKGIDAPLPGVSVATAVPTTVSRIGFTCG